MLSTKRVLADEMQKAEERITALKDETKPLAEAEQAGKELPELETELAALEKEKEEYLLEADRTIAAIEAEIRVTGRRGGADCYRSRVEGSERADRAKRLRALQPA